MVSVTVGGIPPTVLPRSVKSVISTLYVIVIVIELSDNDQPSTNSIKLSKLQSNGEKDNHTQPQEDKITKPNIVIYTTYCLSD